MVTTYAMYVQTFLRVDENEKGLYVEVPGFASDTFKVYCDESGVVPQVTHCRCSHFAHKGTCLHAEIVQAYWNKIYRTNIIKSEEKALEVAMDIEDSIEEQYELAAIADMIVATPATPKFRNLAPRFRRKFATEYVAKQDHLATVMDTLTEVKERCDMMKASLTTNKGFQLMR